MGEVSLRSFRKVSELWPVSGASERPIVNIRAQLPAIVSITVAILAQGTTSICIKCDLLFVWFVSLGSRVDSLESQPEVTPVGQLLARAFNELSDAKGNISRPALRTAVRSAHIKKCVNAL